MTNKQLKQSLENRLNGYNKIIENLENQLKEEKSTQKQRQIKDNLQFQKGFRRGIYIALSDLNYKITRKNKYILKLLIKE